MKAAGKVTAVTAYGDFLEVQLEVKIEKGIRRGARAEFKVYVPPHEARAYWIGRRVNVSITPCQERG